LDQREEIPPPVPSEATSLSMTQRKQQLELTWIGTLPALRGDGSRVALLESGQKKRATPFGSPNRNCEKL
jgi:hypothetical protein